MSARSFRASFRLTFALAPNLVKGRVHAQGTRVGGKTTLIGTLPRDGIEVSTTRDDKDLRLG